MPMEISKQKTPKGNDYLHTHSSGDVTAADAEKLNAAIEPGMPMADLAIFGKVENGTTFSPEARQAFTKSSSGPGKPVAVVVSSAPMRVMLSFIIRLTAAAGSTKFFSSEADALAWIDERLAERKS